MLVRSYLAWCSQAPADERAEAAAMLARAYLDANLAPEDRYEAEAALTLALDDPAAVVRRALAEVLAASERAPHHVISALATDQSDVGALVLARSPLITDEQLVDFAALGDTLAQVAIAMRSALSAPVCAAIAEIGSVEALIVLVRNIGAHVPEFSLQRMLDRLGDDAEFREALLDRPGLPVGVRARLTEAVGDSLSRFVMRCGWLSPSRAERIVREACDTATVLIGQGSDERDLLSLVNYLRKSGNLTPSLILRSLLCGDNRLLIAALSDLAQMSPARVAGLVCGRSRAAFSALYRRAGMPTSLEPAFVAALASLARHGIAAGGGEARLQRAVILDTLEACERQKTPEFGSLLAMLHRFNAESARQEARQVTAELLAAPAAVTMPIDVPAQAAQRQIVEIPEPFVPEQPVVPETSSMKRPVVAIVEPCGVDLDRLQEAMMQPPLAEEAITAPGLDPLEVAEALRAFESLGNNAAEADAADGTVPVEAVDTVRLAPDEIRLPDPPENLEERAFDPVRDLEEVLASAPELTGRRIPAAHVLRIDRPVTVELSRAA